MISPAADLCQELKKGRAGAFAAGLSARMPGKHPNEDRPPFPIKIISPAIRTPRSLRPPSGHVDPDTYDWVRDQLEEDYRNLKALSEEEAASLKKEQTHNLTAQNSLTLRLASANPAITPSIERQIEHFEHRNGEIKARLEQLEKGEQAVSLDEINETLELSKALKDNYLAAKPERRAKFNKLMFRMIRVARKGEVARAYKSDPLRGKASFDVVWNEPFATLEGSGLIQGMDGWEGTIRTKSQPTKTPKNKGKRAWRESNPRPAA